MRIYDPDCIMCDSVDLHGHDQTFTYNPLRIGDDITGVRAVQERIDYDRAHQVNVIEKFGEVFDITHANALLCRTTMNDMYMSQLPHATMS